MGEISDKNPAPAGTIAFPSTTLCVVQPTLFFRGPYHPLLGPSKTTLSLQWHFRPILYKRQSCACRHRYCPRKIGSCYNLGWTQTCDSSVQTSRYWGYKHTHLALLWFCCICPKKPGCSQSQGFQGRGRCGREQTTLEGPITMATSLSPCL